MPFPALCSLSFGVFMMLCLGACERKQRARERDLELARAAAKAPPPERTATPIPEEPPFGPLRAERSGLPCAVDDAFAAKCRRCHTIPARHGAPFVLLTWEDMQQLRNEQPLHQLVGRAVRSGFMPYKIEANPPVLPLTDEEKRAILDWVEAGAPREDCDPSPRGLSKSGPTGGSANPAPRAAKVAAGAGAKPAPSAVNPSPPRAP